MTGKHTPGPWGPDTTINVRGGAVSIGWLCSSEPGSPSDVEARANARLIAAAPELLEALQELMDLMDHVTDGNYSPDSFTTQPARAAIAKALGQDPLDGERGR